MVCPPDTIRSTPRSRKAVASPSRHTRPKKPYALLRRSVGRLLACFPAPAPPGPGRRCFEPCARRPRPHTGCAYSQFCQLQGAVFLRLGQGRTGDVRVYMDLERIVVLADDQAIADGAEIRPQGLNGGIFPFAYNEHRVEGEGDLLLAEGGEIGLALGLFLAHIWNLLARRTAAYRPVLPDTPFRRRPPPRPFSAPGSFQWSRPGSPNPCGWPPCRTYSTLLHSSAASGGPVGGQTGDCQHRALCGLHHSAVGGGYALLQSAGQLHTIGLLIALEILGHTPKQQGEDNAGVSSRASAAERRR